MTIDEHQELADRYYQQAQIAQAHRQKTLYNELMKKYRKHAGIVQSIITKRRHMDEH